MTNFELVLFISNHNFLNKFICLPLLSQFRIYVPKELGKIGKGQTLLHRLEPKSFFKRSSSAEEPVSAGASAGAAGAAAAARNAGVWRAPAGSEESIAESAALASPAPPRAPRSPAMPPLCPPKRPSRGSSSAAGSGSAAGCY